MRALAHVLSIASLLVAAGTAHAVPVFTLAGGAAIVEQGNDFLWIAGPITESGTLGVSEDAILRIEYIGKEAGFANEFWLGSAGDPGALAIAATAVAPTILEGQTAALPFPPPDVPRGLAPHATTLDAGVVPFHFRVGDEAASVVANGDPPNPSGPDFAFWWPDSAGALGDTVYVLLDDGGGLNPGDPSDNDHDDMIVRLTVRPIPEPGTCVLVSVGLGVLGAVRPRRAR
jgi:hypothetical protein